MQVLFLFVVLKDLQTLLLGVKLVSGWPGWGGCFCCLFLIFAVDLLILGLLGFKVVFLCVNSLVKLDFGILLQNCTNRLDSVGL
jgi:hypothetical protein